MRASLKKIGLAAVMALTVAGAALVTAGSAQAQHWHGHGGGGFGPGFVRGLWGGGLGGGGAMGGGTQGGASCGGRHVMGGAPGALGVAANLGGKVFRTRV